MEDSDESDQGESDGADSNSQTDLEGFFEDYERGYGEDLFPSEFDDEFERLNQLVADSSAIPDSPREGHNQLGGTDVDPVLDLIKDQYNLRSELEEQSNEIGKKIDHLTDLERDIEESKKELTEELARYEGQIDEMQERTKDLQDKVDDRIEEYNTASDDYTQLAERLEENIQKSEELLETASNLVQREAGSSIGVDFSERKKELESSLRWWKAGSAISIIMLIISAFLIYQDISSTALSQGYASLSKVLLLLPISVAVWFTSSNYNQQKKLMEEYEFKSNIALSLMGFREVLREELPEDERDKIGQFVIDTMEKIYSDPIETINSAEQNEDNGELTQNSIASLLNNR